MSCLKTLHHAQAHLNLDWQPTLINKILTTFVYHHSRKMHQGQQSSKPKEINPPEEKGFGQTGSRGS